LIAAATPTTTAPASHILALSPSHNARTTSPIISASLWAPPTKSMTSSGFSVASHAVSCASTPIRSAIRGSSTTMSTTPMSAGMRMSTAER